MLEQYTQANRPGNIPLTWATESYDTTCKKTSERHLQCHSGLKCESILKLKRTLPSLPTQEWVLEQELTSQWLLVCRKKNQESNAETLVQRYNVPTVSCKIAEVLCVIMVRDFTSCGFLLEASPPLPNHKGLLCGQPLVQEWHFTHAYKQS